MAKLDEFGRPIYETAEEYNKAHRGGVCPRPYDTSEGSTYKKATAAQRYATVKQSKNLKSVVIGLGIGVVLINALIIFSMFNMSMDSEFGESVYETELVGTEVLFEDGFYDEYLGTGEEPLPEGFDTFFLNVRLCSLPTTLNKIIDLGFHMEEFNAENEMVPSGWEEIVELYDDETGAVQVTVRVSNQTDYDIPMYSCTVDYFSITNIAAYNSWYDIPYFKFGDTLNFESTYDELEVYFGIPYYHSEYYSEGYEYDHYEWAYYGAEDIQVVAVTFVDDLMLEVSIEKTPVEEK